MTSKERVNKSLQHQQTDKVAIDFGATPVTGIHVLAIENLRKYYGLEQKPVKVVEPYQMLGEIDRELMEIMGVDVIGLDPAKNMFGIDNHGKFKEFSTFWGQTLLLPDGFKTSLDQHGDLLIYPEGDTSVPASGKMPKSGYFFDAVIRQEPIDETTLDPKDNLEEFAELSESEINFWRAEIKRIKDSDKAIIANLGGTAFGDIALVPGLNLKHPRGIRDISEWYMSVIMRPDYIREVFEKQAEIALRNLTTFHEIAGENIDAIFLCGTDFGTQDSQFCGLDTFEEVYLPYYKKINTWIHQHTTWKTFKHSCGAVEPFIDKFIEAGFDILNPVQINAKGMDPAVLKKKYGDRICFWGGGVDTQHMLPFGTPEEVAEQVKRECEILATNGGFIFNTVHNIQANVPVANIVAMINALQEIR